MQYEELKAQVEAVPAAQAKDYRELLALASIAGGVWPRPKGHLEAAEDCRGFFQAIYDDEACRFENAWAYWAKMNKEPWADRFEAEKAVRGVRLENKGIFIEGNGNELLVPLQGRGHAANVYCSPRTASTSTPPSSTAPSTARLRAWGWSWRAPSISTARTAPSSSSAGMSASCAGAPTARARSAPAATARPPGSPLPSRGRRGRPRDGEAWPCATVPQMEGQGWAWQ